MIVAPAVPSFRLEPVCSGCQCVLKSVRTGPPLGSAATACANAAAFSRKSAIHQHDAVGSSLDDDVAAGAGEQKEVVAQWGGSDFRSFCKNEAS